MHLMVIAIIFVFSGIRKKKELTNKQFWITLIVEKVIAPRAWIGFYDGIRIHACRDCP